MRDEAGFTVAELMLVAVFVIGLVAVAVVSVRGIQESNRTTHCQTELRTLKLAVGEFHASEGRYPESVAELEDHDLLGESEVDDWTFDLGSDDEAPTFEPSSGACVLT